MEVFNKIFPIYSRGKEARCQYAQRFWTTTRP